MKLIQPNFSWQKFLLSWHGRVPRRQYWVLFTLCLCVPLSLISYFVDDYLGMSERTFPPTLIASNLLFFWTENVILIKRLHDINLSAWQYFRPLLICLFIVILSTVLLLIKKHIFHAEATLKGIIGIAMVVLSAPFLIHFIWLTLLTMFKRGTDGDNRFGPDIRQQIIKQIINQTSTKTESDTTA